jgi:hypothetical protein
MNYSKVNKVLAKEFGKGQVKVKPAEPDADWEYVLWFLEDHPSQETIARAEEIVNQIQPTRWMPEKAFISEH